MSDKELINDLVKLANTLDEKGMHKNADEVDSVLKEIIKKISQTSFPSRMIGGNWVREQGGWVLKTPGGSNVALPSVNDRGYKKIVVDEEGPTENYYVGSLIGDWTLSTGLAIATEAVLPGTYTGPKEEDADTGKDTGR